MMTTKKAVQTEEQRWKEFGKWLGSKRIGMRLKKTEAAAAAGISFSSWVMYEAGGRVMQGEWKLPNPTPETIVGLARAIGVPQREVFAKAGMDPMYGDEETVDTDRISGLEDKIAGLADMLGSLMEELRSVKGQTAGSRRRAG